MTIDRRILYYINYINMFVWSMFGFHCSLYCESVLAALQVYVKKIIICHNYL